MLPLPRINLAFIEPNGGGAKRLEAIRWNRERCFNPLKKTHIDFADLRFGTLTAISAGRASKNSKSTLISARPPRMCSPTWSQAKSCSNIDSGECYYSRFFLHPLKRERNCLLGQTLEYFKGLVSEHFNPCACVDSYVSSMRVAAPRRHRMLG